jgi:hypothetical protein
VTFYLTVDMDNAAFDNTEDGYAAGAELARILRAAAKKIDGVHAWNFEGPHSVRDINGNRVGSWRVADAADLDEAQDIARCILDAWEDAQDIPVEAYRRQTGREYDDDARILARIVRGNR